MTLERASSFINLNQVVASVDAEEREERASFDIWMEAKGSCIPARNVGQEPFNWCALRVARFLWALQDLPWTSCISLRTGAKMGRYLEGMVSISSFILPAVEIAWIVAASVAALLPLTAAVAVPMAAGEEPRMGSVE
jgi:hypothetical protein